MSTRRFVRRPPYSTRGAVAILSWACLLAALGRAQAHPFSIDQANDTDPPQGGYNIPIASPVGQEFVPTMNRLDVVELQMNAQSPFIGGDAMVQIRSDSIVGPILGASQTVTIPPIVLPLTLAHFDFASPVPLTPGALYVIEVISLTSNLGVFGTGLGDDYPPGRAIAFGQPTEFDLWFREGTAQPVSVEPSTWGRIKTEYR
mgnify:CR=1 FL=1